MKFRPLHDRVLIKVLDSEENLWRNYHPRHSKRETQEGEVVAVELKMKTAVAPMDVKVGDIVYLANGQEPK